jgi:hypothetical protein
MTTTPIYRPANDTPTRQGETKRLPAVPARTVHMSTLHLELKPRRSPFECITQPGECDRHPEWYIG